MDKKFFHPIIPGNREELLSSFIVDASICFKSMEGPINFDNLDWEVIKKGIFHHSCVILEMSNNKFVLLEYGPYPRDNYEDLHNFNYPLGNGFRYSVIDVDEIEEKVRQNEILIINSENLGYFGRWCVSVKVRRRITLNDLIRELGDKWKKKDYWLYFYDCQEFTIKVIEILNIESKYKSWYIRNMRNSKFIYGLLYYLAYAYRVPRELAKRISNYYEIDN